jgi:large subunit ribosomal protein L9
MPEAILLKDVENVGAKGTVVEVSKGYLRNFLIPRKLAQPATKAALVEARRITERLEAQRVQARAQAEETAEALGKTVLTIVQQAGDDGRLFGSVTAQDIVDAIKEARGVDLERRKVKLGEAIKTLGTHQVDVEVGDGVTASVKVMVTES